MSEITHEDLNRIYDKINENDKKRDSQNAIIHASLTSITVTIAEIAQYQKLNIRPCSELKGLQKTVNGHLAEHQETKRLWQQPIVRSIIHLIELAVVALLAAFLAS